MWTNTARTIDVRAALQGLSPKGLLTAGTVVLTALLAVQTGRLIWIVAVPPGGVGVAAAAEASPVRDADLSILSRFDAFYRGEPAGEPLVQTSAPETTGGSFQLFGVRVAGNGGGSAILAGPDGRQLSVAVGEEAAPGVTLISVATDHAVIRRGGQAERIEFARIASPPPPPQPSQIAPAVPPANAPTPAAAAVDRSSVVSAIGLRPRRVEGRVRGFEVIPRGSASALAQAGLRPGDVILTVNGQEVTVENQTEMLQDLRNAPQAVIAFEREGQPMSVSLRTSQP